MIWEPKTPGETRRYRWNPSLEEYETIATASGATDSGTVTLTVTNEVEDGKEGVTVLVAGGAAGETARISIDVTTSEGQAISGVFFVPVRAESPVLGNTARDVCNFALRKVVGNDATATASELDDALERLNAMLMLWRIDGLDVGIAKELAATDTLDIPDPYITAIKWCLREDVHAYYDVPMNAHDARMAFTAKRALVNDLLDLEELSFEPGLSREAGYWNFSRGY